MEQIPVSSSPVKRGENLTEEQRQYLIEIIEAHKEPLTDKRNDLQTIHRKKHTWERITNDFNHKFSHLLRRRSIQQIQTWYKNEKARCRRVLIRQRLRQQNASSVNATRHLRRSLDDAETTVMLSDERIAHMGGFDHSRTSPDICEMRKDASVDHQTATTTQSSPAMTVPPLLTLASHSDDTGTVSPSLFTSSPTNTILSFLRTQAHSSMERLSAPFFPTESLKATTFDTKPEPLSQPSEVAMRRSSSTERRHITYPPAEQPNFNNFSTKHQHSPSLNDEDDINYETRLFDRRMEVLAMKEQCIRKYYDKKESVLKVKEEYYKLKLQLLRDQVLSGQSGQMDARTWKTYYDS